jgi:predicted nuclease of predicted toxin-antitoxin system
MRILFDHDVPRPLRYCLPSPEHTVETAAEKGWHRLKNSTLLDAAEANGFDLFITADKGFIHQQSLKRRRIKIVVLTLGNWPDVKLSVPRILEGIGNAQPGACTVVECVSSLR